MTRLQFTIRSPRTAEDVVSALVDFSPERPIRWPAIDPAVYRVHSVADTSADVTEGSAVMGGIWAREHYDWSTPGVVRATIAESNFWHPGGIWEARVRSDHDGGCTIQITRDRTPRILRARILELMLRLVGRKVLSRDLVAAPAISGAAAPVA